MSSFFPLNANDDVRAATRNAWILVRALMISSAMPSVKYSFSGSALMLTNGSTAIDFGALAPAGVPGGVEPLEGHASAWADWAAVAERSVGALASAFRTAWSSHSATSSRGSRSDG